MREYYTIRELRREFDITARTLRYYEEEGLLQPLRRGRDRLYTQPDHNRLQQILRARRLGFSLKEITAMFGSGDKRQQTVASLRQMLEDIESRRSRMQQMRRDINQTLHELEAWEEELFERLAELGVAH